MLNRGTDVWAVEHECKRPKASGLIYDPSRCRRRSLPYRTSSGPRAASAAPWASTGGGSRSPSWPNAPSTDVVVREARIFDSKPIGDLVQYLVELRARVGDFVVYGDAENAYGNLDCRNAGFEVVPVPFNKFKDEGIENVARYFDHGKLKIADHGDLQTVVRQLLRYHRNDTGKIVKKDDHGPDALMCAMLPFPVHRRVRLAALAAALGHRPRAPEGHRTSCWTGASTSRRPRSRASTRAWACRWARACFYVVISTLPDIRHGDTHRKAVFIGRVATFEELDDLLKTHCVERCVISAQPEPHLVQHWAREWRYAYVFKLVYTNDGYTKPRVGSHRSAWCASTARSP